jgi:hypothetical protein
MIRRATLPLLFLVSCFVFGQASNPGKSPAAADLKATSERGTMLADYDVAAWHATDAVEALKPDHAAAPTYLAHKLNDKWEVAFGRMSPQGDCFLIVYRAIEGDSPEQFSAKKSDPPVEDRGFYFDAAKAIGTASKDFGHPARPYNSYVLPTGHGELYVYFLPAQTAEGVYPLGGDVRYSVTLDGSTIVEKHQMHKTIIEKKQSLQPGQTLAGGFHTHALDNNIEDSDVFHVLSRNPPVPEIIRTSDGHVYEIETDGSIKREK